MRAMLLSMMFLLSGCASGPTYESAADSQLIKANYAAAEALAKSVKVNLDKSAPVIVATLVNIDNLESSSTLGRMVSEQIVSRLSSIGYMVKEVKLRGSLFVKSSEGEFLLSRELKEISASHNAQAVVVGTYSDAGDWVYLNLKLIDIHNIIIGAHDYVLPVTQPVGKMLGRR